MKKIFFLLFLVTSLFLIPQFTLALAYKKVDIDLSNQHLYAYEGNQLIYSFPISSGRWAPTPTGTFYPLYKTLSTRMTGGDKSIGTYYDLPNVPYDVFFYQGYALHGAYWHNNFGHPMSHGCVNVAPANMAGLYYWIDYQTPINIFGSAPAY